MLDVLTKIRDYQMHEKLHSVVFQRYHFLGKLNKLDYDFKIRRNAELIKSAYEVIRAIRGYIDRQIKFINYQLLRSMSNESNTETNYSK